MNNMYEFEEFNDFGEAQNFILKNIPSNYDEMFLVVDTPDSYFVFIDEYDVCEFIIQRFHEGNSSSFETYQNNYDFYVYMSKEQKENHPFLYRKAYWVDEESGNVYKQKMYVEAEYDISVSLSAY